MLYNNIVHPAQNQNEKSCTTKEKIDHSDARKFHFCLDLHQALNNQTKVKKIFRLI